MAGCGGHGCRTAPRPRESPHLSFGAGIHYCFGAPLARLETEIALTELARRLENPRLLADPPPYRPSPLLHGPAHLPIGFDRIRPARESGTPRHDVALSLDQKLARISAHTRPSRLADGTLTTHPTKGT